MASKITELLENAKEKVVLIKADEEVEYGAVMKAMDQLRQAGIEDIGLITDPKKTAAKAEEYKKSKREQDKNRKTPPSFAARAQAEKEAVASKAAAPATAAAIRLNALPSSTDPDYYKKLGELLVDPKNWTLKDAAVDALLRASPDDIKDPEVLKQIARNFRELAREEGHWTKGGKSIRGLVMYGGKFSVPILVDLLDRQTTSASPELFDGLAALPDPRGAEALCRQLGNTFNHAEAVNALRKMGPVAEDSLIKAAPSNNATYPAAANIAMIATATSNVTGGSISKVEFYAGSTLLGIDTTAPYSFTWPNVTPGPYTLTAKATDNLGVTTTSTPVTVIVLAAPAPPTISLTSPAAGTEYAIGHSIVLTAQASTPGRIIDRVEFYADGARVGTIPIPGGFASATTSFTWAGAALGAHALLAKVVATDGMGASSATVNVAVSDLAVTLLEPYPGQVYQAPAIIRITPSATTTTGTIVRADFYFDGQRVGSAIAPPYSFVRFNVPAGTHPVKAVVYDGAGLGVETATVNITVLDAPTLQMAPGIDGSTVGDDNVSLAGTVQAPRNAAVSVNGRAASLDPNGSFFIDGVQLQPGGNTVTLVLNAQDGSPVTRTVAVQSTGVAPFQATVDKNEGLGPLEVDLTITNRGAVAFQRIEIDMNGDGSPDITLTGLPDNQSVEHLTYSVPGTYTISVRVYDAANAVIYSAYRKVRVHGADETGRKMVALYNDLVSRLGNSDPAGALRLFTGNAGARYSSVFAALGATLPSVAQQLGNPIAGAGTATWGELSILRSTTNGDRVFMLYMIRGEDGIWRIDSM